MYALLSLEIVLNSLICFVIGFVYSDMWNGHIGTYLVGHFDRLSDRFEHILIRTYALWIARGNVSHLSGFVVDCKPKVHSRGYASQKCGAGRRTYAG